MMYRIRKHYWLYARDSTYYSYYNVDKRLLPFVWYTVKMGFDTIEEAKNWVERDIPKDITVMTLP